MPRSMFGLSLILIAPGICIAFLILVYNLFGIYFLFLVEYAGELHIFILRENWHIFSWFSENLMHFLIELIITFGDHMLAFLWSLEKKFSILGFTVPD